MIEVGEYVRIKHMYNNQKIAKIKGILNKDPYYKNMQMYLIDVIHQHDNGHFKSYKIYEEDIIKHSKNIIDLIEVGDYVNGQLIEKIYKKENDRIYYEFLEHEDGSFEIMEMCELKNIKSIVTKEQFENMEYRLEG